MRSRTVFSTAAVIALGVIGTWQYHLVQFSSKLDTFFGDRGDARGFVYFCEHWYQAFQGKTKLLSPGIFYPVEGTLAYSDLLFGFAIPYSVFRALGFGMFTSVELVIILLTFLTYLASFVLLRFVLRFSLAPSILAAMFFAFSSPKFFQTGHIQLQFVLFLPLIFICVLYFAIHAEKLSQKQAALWLSLAGLFFNLQIVTAFYYAWFFAFWSVLFLILSLLFKRSRKFILSRVMKYWRAIAVAAAVFLMGFIPFLLIYLPTVRVGTWYSYSNVALMIPEWWSLLSMGDGNYVWGWLATAVRPEPWPATWGEVMVGIGLVPSVTWLGLTVYAVILVIRHRTKPNPDKDSTSGPAGHIFLAVTILSTTLFYVLGLKYGDGQSPWYYVYQVFPGAGAIRAMGRYVIFLTLPMSIAFAFVLDRGWKWISRRQKSFAVKVLATILIVVAAFGVFEQFGSFKVGGTGFSVRREQAYLTAMASKLDRDCRAFYIASGKGKQHNAFEYQYDAMLISMLSGVPTLNASSSQFPPKWDLFRVKDPDYEPNVQNWISIHGLNERICRLEIGPQVEAFGPREPNPIDDRRFFVIQHFRDLLQHEPADSEIDPWAAKIQNCTHGNQNCSRPDVALEFFYHSGFSEAGSFIVRLYEVGLGRGPRYEEFESDLGRLRRYVYAEGWEAAKARFATEFSNTSDFKQRYAEASEDQFLASLWSAADLSQRGNVVLPSSEGPDRRGQILKATVESRAVVDRFADRAFVTLLYFGYLRRGPDEPGLKQWLDTLSETKNRRHVVMGFIDSSEYRERFGEM